jgi:hypothetical protein
MKLFDPGPYGTKTLTPKAQLWVGLFIAIFSLCSGCVDIFYPSNAGSHALAFIYAPCGLIAGLGLAWQAWRKDRAKLKTGSSAPPGSSDLSNLEAGPPSRWFLRFVSARIQPENRCAASTPLEDTASVSCLF